MQTAKIEYQLLGMETSFAGTGQRREKSSIPTAHRTLPFGTCLVVGNPSRTRDQDFYLLPPRDRVFLGRLAQPILDVAEGACKLDVGEGALNFDIGHEQLALITFQASDLKSKVVGHGFNSSPLGQMLLFP